MGAKGHRGPVKKKKKPPERPERDLQFGDVCPGWHPEAWRDYLVKRALDCDAMFPDLAKHYRKWAAAIDVP